jgi:uncharacterized protein (TIGR04255 family)
VRSRPREARLQVQKIPSCLIEATHSRSDVSRGVCGQELCDLSAQPLIFSVEASDRRCAHAGLQEGANCRCDLGRADRARSVACRATELPAGLRQLVGRASHAVAEERVPWESICGLPLVHLRAKSGFRPSRGILSPRVRSVGSRLPVAFDGVGVVAVRFSLPPELSEDPVTFKRPPVGEVALAVQFDQPVVDLEVLAEVTRLVRDDFPNREQHPPLPPMDEDFSVPPRGPSLHVEFASQFVLPRSWFISGDNAKLIQIQADRFVFNWRRQLAADAYPRYRPLRHLFATRIKQLWDALEVSGKRLPTINFCEVTYVNHIDVPGAVSGGNHADLGEVVEIVKPWSLDGFLPRPEDANLQTRFRITANDDSNSVGRLYVGATPAFRQDGLPIYVLSLVSRIIPQGEEMAAMWTALDTGRDWIVRGFEQLTTEKMHRYWNESD